MPVVLLTEATTGAVPVTTYCSFTPSTGKVAVIVPVGVVQSGCTVTDAVAVAGDPGATFTVKDNAVETQPVKVFSISTS